MKHVYQTLNKLALFLITSVLLFACSKEDYTQTTSTDANITTYLSRDPEQFSEFSKILKIAEAAGYLNAYGTFTLFAPTNDAIKIYLQKYGYSSVEQVDAQQLKDLVKFHLIADTLSTASFTDGKMSGITEYGQFLVTSVSNESGTARYRINRQADIIQPNISTGNGIIHVIDRVLEPAKYNLAQLIEQDSRLSIFTEALKATGYYDTLSRAITADSTGFLTVLAQTDEIFAKSNISSFADLKRKYSNTGDPKNSKDSLHLFVAYHILPDARFLADIVSSPTHETLAPLEVIAVTLQDQTIILNEDTDETSPDPGVEVNRDGSDIQATNGALHTVLGNVEIKVRKPKELYWDVCDQPELRKLVSVFRKVGQTLELTDPTQYNYVKWEGGDRFQYVVTTSDFLSYNDNFSIFLRPARTKWVELTTPILIKGKYKVWICYRRTRKQTIQTQFDDEPMTRLLEQGDYYPSTLDDNNAEALGYKRYINSTINNNVGRLVGIADVKTTGRHRIKFVPLTDESGEANKFCLDMIHFIPVDMEQKWPRFNKDGSRAEKP